MLSECWEGMGGRGKINNILKCGFSDYDQAKKTRITVFRLSATFCLFSF